MSRDVSLGLAKSGRVGPWFGTGSPDFRSRDVHANGEERPAGARRGHNICCDLGKVLPPLVSGGLAALEQGQFPDVVEWLATGLGSTDTALLSAARLGGQRTTRPPPSPLRGCWVPTSDAAMPCRDASFRLKDGASRMDISPESRAPSAW